MTSIDYNIFYKTELPLASTWGSQSWDIFVSAFNSSERVRMVFDRVSAKQKYWLIHNEYEYAIDELPNNNIFTSSHTNEAPFIRSFVERVETDTKKRIRDLAICIDITGF